MFKFTLLKRIIKDISTEVNGQDYDITRILAIIGFLFFLGLSTYTVYNKKDFDYIAFATGLGAIIALVGVGVSQGSKEKNRPGSPNNPSQDN